MRNYFGGRMWEKVRAGGFWRFVFHDGVLGFGTLFGWGNLLLSEWQGDLPSDHLWITKRFVEALIVGTLWGCLMWLWMERFYRRRTTH